MSFVFRHHVIDLDLPAGLYGQTALADLDGDGILEYVVGQQFGTIYCYKFHSPDRWTRSEIGLQSPSDVGLTVVDIDGDGRPDLVAGGAWYRNPGHLDGPWERVEFDADLGFVHDVAQGDINGDGKAEILTMSDRNDLRWYRIPDDPASAWTSTLVSAPVHAGLSVGDIDGDGTIDLVRTDRWYRNVNGDATAWEVNWLGPNTMPPNDYQPHWAFDGTITHVRDINGDGHMDILIADAEIPGGKIWWLENVHGHGKSWKRHDIYNPNPEALQTVAAPLSSDPSATGPRRGAFHSLVPIDMTGDGSLDVVTAEMEGVPGEIPPRYYVYENVHGDGSEWREHVVLDENLGGHALVAGDVTGNGKPDIIGKPWNPSETNAVGGKVFVVFLENLG